MVTVPPEQLWMVISGFIIAFVLAFGIGGNDVANSFGTSYGAKVLTLRQVCILASIFETLGAVLLGAKVSDTIRKGIIDIEPYKNDTDLLMMGNVAALSGSCIWLIIATLLRLPVSATHSIVGATVGFALVAHGMQGVNLRQMGMIIMSWFVSPLLAGAVSSGLFVLCKFCILNKDDPLESGLRWLPVFYAVTIVINLFSVFYDGPEMLGFDKIPLWGTFVISFGTGLICCLVVRFLVVPWQRRKIKDACRDAKNYQAPLEEDATREGGMRFSFTLDDDPDDDPDSPAPSGENSPMKGGSECDLSKDEIAMEQPKGARVDAPEKKADNEPDEEHHPPTKKHSLHFPHMPHMHTPIPASGKVLTEITKHPTDSPAKQATPTKAATATVNGKLKISKDEDAPLVDNEYIIGSRTPRRVNTEDDLLKKKVNGGKEPTANGKDLDVEGKLEVVDSSMAGRENIKDGPETVKLFSFLQILTAIFGGFAHGGNDVSNAIGPLVSLWLTGTTGHVMAKASTPIWILLYGGVGISLGLWTWGRRVMKTMGEDLTKITPSSGFCIEIGTAITVLIASNIGIPISTTHCKVGSIVFVGRVRSRDNVDWSIFRNIMLAWCVTLPVSGGISAALMAVMMQFV